MGSLPRIVRILASVRLPSSYGPGVEYEMLHAVIRPDTESPATIETVVLRWSGEEGMYRGGAPEILMQDLPAVHAQWIRFVTDVLWRRAQAGDTTAQAALDKIEKHGAPAASEAQTAPIVISASGGRFGPRAKMPAPLPPAPVPAVAAGPKKAAARPEEPVAKPAPPAAVPSAPPAPAPRVPRHHQVIAFNLSTPPNAEGLLGHIAAHPQELIAVAPVSIASKVETYLHQLKSGKATGPPSSFSPIVVRYPTNFSAKKLRAELATAVIRMLGEMNTSLWIIPE